jgi:hypothetical protein
MSTLKYLAAGAAFLGLLAAAGAGAEAATLAALTGQRTLLHIDTNFSAVTRQVTVAGSGRLVGIDVRPFDGKLYGVFANGSVVTIAPLSGTTTPKPPLAQTLPPGVRASLDFNPAADRLRMIGSDGTNLRANVDDGTVTVDTPINLVQPNPFGGVTPSVIAAAYTNSVAGTKATLLFDVDDATDALYLQIPPNAGALNAVGAQLGISPGQSFGFDIATTRGGTNIPWLINGNRLFQPGLLSGLAFRGKVVRGLNVPVRDLAVLSVN